MAVDGLTMYAYISSDTGGEPMDIEQANEAYTLLSGSHIGLPYELGQSWTYDAHVIPTLFGICYPPSEAHALTLVTVVSANQTITVPAGTFNDCFEIQVETAAPGMQTMWVSATAQSIVKSVDDQTWDHTETVELLSYTLVY